MSIIKIDDVMPGMVLVEDIEDLNTGNILLKSGTVLNKKNILHLKNMNINYLNVLEITGEIKEVNQDKQKSFIDKYDNLAKKTKKVLKDVKLGKKIIISEISDEVNDIIDEITSSNNILSRLRQIEESDDYTFQHSLTVCMLSIMLGKWLGYTWRELKQLALSGLFHDIGKLRVSRDIIEKPSRLNEMEFNIVKKHTIFGYNILMETVGISQNTALGALQHHEREDGSGYPLRLKSDKIHEFGKIIAVCDIFNAMTSKRIYEDKKSPFKVAELISENRFGVLDARISTVFLDNISKFYVGNLVKLSNGVIGEIVYVNKNIPTRPVVRVEDDFVDLMKLRDIEIIDIIE
ncbi:HDIG domain-containing protein [Caloranaerobacter azorensis DSM 13643]|uniref:HDIG domain-containing protein n=1 Tax=Caloranaerobacter azorensis DSM 13643 TaxID=1121264 RepID=A0A1M5UM43_9FIRM|nr:HD-GYP domain-containing protein [Caloranaerobacter azorensis]SHH63938.1 HDIG domain-containing protein [Caloranaerobacter azorensis DSM 13643]